VTLSSVPGDRVRKSAKTKGGPVSQPGYRRSVGSTLVRLSGARGGPEDCSRPNRRKRREARWDDIARYADVLTKR
jgi:hypothetical protein